MLKIPPMDDAQPIPHEAAVAAAADVQPAKARPRVTMKGIGEAFATVGALVLAGGLLTNMVRSRLTGGDTADRIEHLQNRANLSFMPMSDAEKASTQAQIDALLYEQNKKHLRVYAPSVPDATTSSAGLPSVAATAAPAPNVN